MTPGHPTQRAGRCVMSGQCGRKSIFSPPLNCAVDLIPAMLPSPSHRDRLVSMCGPRYQTGPVCCDVAQLQTLDSSIQIAQRFIAACPACWANMQSFWCDFICHPDQATFLNVTDTQLLKNSPVVTKVDYLVRHDFAQGFFDSCKDIKFGPDNRFVMDFIGGGASSPQQFLDFMGAPKPEVGGSPFPIHFPQYDPSLQHYVPHAPPIGQCNSTDPLLRCSCVDCSPICPILPPLSDHNQNSLPAVPTCTLGPYECRVAGGIILVSFIISAWVAWIVARFCFQYIQSKRRNSAANNSNFFVSAPTGSSISPQETQDTRPLLSNSDPTENEPTIDRGEMLGSSSSDYDDSEHVIDVDGLPIRVHVLHSIQPTGTEALFMKLGWYTTEYPITTIVSVLVIVLVCVSGWWVNTGLNIITDPIDLWVPPNSPAMHAKSKFDAHFGPFFRTQQIILSSNNGSVLDEHVFQQLFILQTKLTTSSTPDNISLSEICSHPLPTVPTPGGCIVQSVTGYWQHSLETFTRSDWRAHLDSCLGNPAQTKCLPPYGQPIKPNMVIDQSPAEPRALIVTFVNRNTDGSTLDAHQFLNKALKWELWFRQELEYWAFNGTQVAYSTESSIETEVSRATSADGWIILVSYVAMIAYIISRLRSPTVGFTAVLLVLLSLCMAMGIMAWFRVPASFILLEVLPFLALAIGVDNVFLLVEALHAVKVFPSSKVRVAVALSRQGPGFLVSFACEVLVFLTASLINIPAVSTFALYAATTVACLFFLQCTLFVSILSNIHVPSIKHSTILWSKYVCWLIRHRWALLVTVFGTTAGAILMLGNVQLGLDQRDALPQDSHLSPYFDALDTHFNAGPPVYYMVDGIDLNSGSVLDDFTSMCGRFADCRNVSVPNLLEQERKRPRSSYIASPATAWLDDFVYWLQPFPEWDQTNPASCCSWHKDSPNSFCDPNVDSISNCISCIPTQIWDPTSIKRTVQPVRTVLPKLIAHWLNSVPSAECPQAGAAYRDTVGRDLTAYAFRTQSVVLNNQTALIYGKSAHEQVANEIADLIGRPVTAYSVFHPFFAQYEDLGPTTWKLMGVAHVLVCVLAYVFLSSVRHAVILVLAMVIMLLWISGAALGMAQIPLNGVSVVNLVMATGLGVEFCVHILRAYVTPTAGHGAQYLGPPARTRKERVRQALLGAGASVLSGIGWTKLVGVLVLAFAKSTIFRKYYFLLYLCILVAGLIVGLLVLPLLLLFFGMEDVKSPNSQNLLPYINTCDPVAPRLESAEDVDTSTEDMVTPKPAATTLSSDTPFTLVPTAHRPLPDQKFNGAVSITPADQTAKSSLSSTQAHDTTYHTAKTSSSTSRATQDANSTYHTAKTSSSTTQPISISSAKQQQPTSKVKFEVGSIQGASSSAESTAP